MSLDFNLNTHYVSEQHVVFFLLPKVGVALLVGTMIGIEREYRGKLAGIKTNALICAASALFTAGSILMAEYGTGTTGTKADVTRIVAQIVSGIGFIGAGTIFKSSSKIQGLTTATMIWTVAALGILIGYGVFFATILIALCFIAFLSVVTYVENRLFRTRKHKAD